MIKADHKKWAEFIFDIYLKLLLKKSFNDFRIINSLPIIDESKSLVITPNHFSWWDGFFVYWLNKNLIKRTLYVMMLEEQLRRYWFFQKLGCYSVDLNDNKKMITSLKYSVDLFYKPKNLVTIYPQGKIQSFEIENLELKNGISYLCKQSKKEFQILPVAFKIEHTKEKLPIVYGRFGKLLSSKQVANFPQIYNDEFVSNLEDLKKKYSSTTYKSLFSK